MTTSTATAQRAELIRTLGASVYTPPPLSTPLHDALGLPALTGAEHTRAFVLSAPPHAAIHLGPEGKLGGTGLDRVEGFWRAAGEKPPTDADHLGVLLMCYADLVDRADSELHLRVAESLFYEHIWPWAPGYLHAVALLGLDAIQKWAALTMATLADTYQRSSAPQRLPLALREAPEPLSAQCDFNELLDTLLSPIRCGLVLTHHTLSAGAAAIGVGYRRGERRFALKAILDQNKTASLTWLAEHSRLWSVWHAQRSDMTSQWWQARAQHSAEILMTIGAQAS
jgi:hypothetical protein